MADAIEAMRSAFGSDTETPRRQLVGRSLVMPGRVHDRIGVKIISTTPGNPTGVVVLFDSDGSLLGLVDGPTLTTIRTGAVAGLATDLLAPHNASAFTMIGAGAMARDQITAIREVRPIERVVVWSRDPEKASTIADEVGGAAATTIREAVDSADIITTATPSVTPLFDADMLRHHVHVNAIGAFTPSMVEIPPEFLREAFVVVDSRAAAAAEAGDLIQAGREPDMEMAELLAGPPDRAHGRTLFKSVGVATQDVAAAAMALKNAERMRLGVTTDD